MGKKVSVIIPAYNAGKYIKESLDSVCSHSYDNLQIIAIDDGSTDETFDIIKSFADKDRRVVPIKKENGGVSSARNMGLTIADGNYIAFLDADDIFEKDAIETLVRAMELSRSELVSCRYSRWDEDGNRLDDYNFIEGERSFSSDNERIRFLTEEYLNYYMGYEVWGKLYRTDIIKGNDILFSEECRIGEDLAFNLKYLLHVQRLTSIPERCVRYMVRSDSAMGKHKDISDMIKQNELLLEDVWEYAAKADKDDFVNKFPVIYIKLMENTYVGLSAAQVADAYDRIEEKSFSKKMYCQLDEKKEVILDIYPEELQRIKFSYHKYIKGKLCGESAFETAYRLIYDCYRKLKRRESVKEWKMIYS